MNDSILLEKQKDESHKRRGDSHNDHLIIRKRRNSYESGSSRDEYRRGGRKHKTNKIRRENERSNEWNKQPKVDRREFESPELKRDNYSKNRHKEISRRNRNERYDRNDRRRSPSVSSKSSRRRSSSGSLPSHLKSESSTENRRDQRGNNGYRQKYYSKSKPSEDPLEKYRTRFAPVHHGELIRK